jgi:outer membrane protein OmpA-like peptidoglycan-associated protein
LNVRLALGILLVLGLADLALLNLHLAPQLAMEQAAATIESAKTPHVPSVPVASGTAPRVAPLPTASAVAAVSAVPTGAVSVAAAPPPVTVAPPPVTVAPPPVAVAPVPAPTPAPTPAPLPPSTPGEAIADVLFDLDSFQIAYLPSIVALKRAAEELRNDPSRRLLLRGHTDLMGPASYKQALSRRRAMTVQMFLVSHGAPLDRITVEAVGDSEPEDPGHNPVAWAKNRRVQVLWR